MPLMKNILHRKQDRPRDNEPPEIRFVRSDTHTEEVIEAPAAQSKESSSSPPRKSFGLFRRSVDASGTRRRSDEAQSPRESRLSRLHVSHRSRSASTSSVNLPDNLPEIKGDITDAQEREAQWEKRATVLVQKKSHTSLTPVSQQGRSRSSSVGKINDPEGDANIQEAIRLHEAGELEKSTHMFGRLADPNGPNNALSQVLYGLALRHGWGCEPNAEQAVQYLTAAASNSASIEEEALRAGMKKGGAAKGELVLAIYELANCYRNGWGVAKDPVAARQYYETAANLGDTDAMNEVGWCYLEGFGGKKDKFVAAKYYRLAEENGNKTIGNSWIWKDKYSPK